MPLFSVSAFQPFSFCSLQPSTINAQLLCRDCPSRARGGNRLLLQRAATATLWDREAGTRVSKVRTDTGRLFGPTEKPDEDLLDFIALSSADAVSALKKASSLGVCGARVHDLMHA